MDTPIRLGVSTCLLGEKVRYDGGHKYDPFIVNTLGRYVEFVPVCPEVEVGFSIPRESLRLVGNPDDPRLMTTRTKIDYTERMKVWAQRRLNELESEGLCGYIFKSKSPSSGYQRVKVYSEAGMPIGTAPGIFARAFMDRFPLLPVEDEGRLHDARLRENFIERIFVMQRWKAMLKGQRTRNGLIEFHTRHKLLILAHSTEKYRELGRLTASLGSEPLDEILERYQVLLMTALNLKTTVRKNINVLQHIMGYFKTELSSGEKQEILEILDQYREGYIPLIVPVTLMNHFVRKYDKAYLREQFYLNPHPVELKLRNHA